MPYLPDPKNVYSETTAGKFSVATAGALPRVYAPNLWTGKVDVIDPETFESELHTAEGTTVLADGILRIPGTEIVVPLKEVFED